MARTKTRLRQAWLALGVLALGLGLAVGAWGIPSEAGYAGVGPDFLPWLVSAALVLCGLAMLWEVRQGGFRGIVPQTEQEMNAAPYWPGFVWVSGGMVLNALLLTTLGFILSCTLCYVCAVRGLRNASSGTSGGARNWLLDACTGAVIAAPVYWMFTKLLAINLPGLTPGGWI